MARIILVIAAVLPGLIAGLSGGCGSQGPTVIKCTTDSDCPTDALCDRSRQECVTGVDPCDLCLSGEVCQDGRCIPDDTDTCERDQDCPAGLHCNRLLGVCEEGPADGDTLPPDGDAAEGDGEAADGDVDPDPDPEPDAEEGPSGLDGPCADSAGCETGLGCWFGACRQRCNPYDPQCVTPLLCHVPESSDESDLYGSGTGLCVDRVIGGGEADAQCNTQSLPCQANRLCWQNDHCVVYCNPAVTESGCALPKTCWPDEQLGVGLCVRCDQNIGCPPGHRCDNGSCVEQAECALDTDCEQYPAKVCEDGSCEGSCLINGCPVGMCNRNTGRCEAVCMPACTAGQCCNPKIGATDGSGECGDCCSPPCEGRELCQDGACIEPPDCRFGTLTCNSPLVCDEETGLCVKRCPASCGANQYCDETTDYECKDLPSGYCSEENPVGICAAFCDMCLGGICVPNPICCVPDTGACSLFSMCCSGSMCCLSILGNRCCPAGTTCQFLIGCI